MIVYGPWPTLHLLYCVTGRQHLEGEMDQAMQRALRAYVAAWSEGDKAKRDELLERGFAADGQYVDNAGRAAGREELSAMIGQFLATYPGATMAVDSGIDEHDRYARFTWVIRDGDGNVIMPGMDFAAFDAEGMVTQIVGFFGPIPEAA